jgi:hypothetical protein
MTEKNHDISNKKNQSPGLDSNQGLPNKKEDYWSLYSEAQWSELNLWYWMPLYSYTRYRATLYDVDLLVVCPMKLRIAPNVKITEE